MNTRSVKNLFCVLLIAVFPAGICFGFGGSGMGDIGAGGVGVDSVVNPLMGSPSGSLTEPVTSYDPTAITVGRSGIMSGNMIVTGNIGGGKHFRGYLPYGSARDIRANLESTSMDSFLRYSTGSYQPFYSSTGSPISVIRPGSVGLMRSESEKIRGYSGTEGFFTPFSQSLLTQPVTSLPVLEYGIIPVTRYGYERSLLGQVQGYRASEQFVQLTGEPREALVGEQGLLGDEQSRISLLKLSLESTLDVDELKPFEIEEPAEKLEVDKELDVYEQMKKQIGGLAEGLDLEAIRKKANEQIQEAVEQNWKSKAETAKVRMAKILETKKRRLKTLATRGGGTGTSEMKTFGKKYKTFASESGDEFNHYIKAAEQYLKEGKYYQAADAYTLASLYKPLDPLSYVGKSHALFAAGEYLSSSRMLILGLRIFPDYARVKVDLVKMTGDESMIEKRIADLVKWVAVSDSGELHFLVAYICYQMDKEVIAKAAIEQACKKMPAEQAAIALKKVIDESRGGE